MFSSIRLGACAGLFLIALPGCSAGPSPSVASRPSASSAVASGQPQETVKVSYPTFSASVAPLLNAIEKGYYAEERLQLEMIMGGGGVSTPALIAGEVLYTTSSGSAISGIISGAPLKVVYTTEDRPGYELWTSSPDINSVNDIKGKAVGIQTRGDTNEIAMSLFLRNHQLPLNSVSYLAAGSEQNKLAALQSGSVPLVVIGGSTAHQYKTSGGKGKQIADLKQEVKMVYTGLATSDKELQQNRDRTKRFLRATIKGREYFKGFKEQTLDILGKYNHLPRDANELDYDDDVPAFTPGRSADATALLEAAAADHRLGPAALDLARLARRDGRVVVSVLLDATFDSNVDLTPDRTADLTREGDASGGATALLRVAPWGDSGPFVRGTAVMRNQARYDALDLGGGGVAAGWQAGRGGGFLLGEASWDYRELGGAPYLSAPRLLGAARLDRGHGRSVGVAYFARWESFLPASATAWSGLRHFAEADVTAELAPRTSGTLAWHGGRDATRDAALGWWEQGPRALLWLPLGRDARVGFELAYTWRTYSAFDAALGASRQDQFADLSTVLEQELGERWTLRAALGARKAFSNVPDFAYTRFVPMIGIAYTAGIL